MSIEKVGPGGVSNSYGVRSVTTPTTPRTTKRPFYTGAHDSPLSDVSIVNVGVGDFFASRTGAVDASAAFTNAVNTVKNTRSFGITGLSDASSQAVINIPPGEYLITIPEALLGNENNQNKITGLKIQGAGRGATKIMFKPATAAILARAVKWLDIEFCDITFIAQTADCTLFATPGLSNEQQWAFRRCSFYNWRYIVDPDGTNNCSEVIFDDCGNYAMQQNGSWLYIGPTGTSDQFLNYWWINCKHWSTSAPIIDAAKGGHFHLKNVDASDWGASAVASPATPDQGTFLIKLRGASHDGVGVLHMTAHVLRGEFKNDNAKLLYSEWGDYGQITLDAVDITSQTFARTYGPQMVYVKVPNADGAKVTIRDSQMAGGITVAYTDVAWSRKARVEVLGGAWWQKVSPSDVVTFVNPGSNPNPPLVIFENVRCASQPAYNFTAATAYAVWDAAIGSVGIPGICFPATNSEARKRTVRVNSVYGGLKNGTVAYIKLPLGAIVTDFRVSAHAGATSEADGATWTLEADKPGTPVTVSTVTVAGALSAGFNQGGSIVPFKCSTAARTILSVTPSNLSAVDNEINVEISGYW
jgi:hypothetical protein